MLFFSFLFLYHVHVHGRAAKCSAGVPLSAGASPPHLHLTFMKYDGPLCSISDEEGNAFSSVRYDTSVPPRGASDGTHQPKPQQIQERSLSFFLFPLFCFVWFWFLSVGLLKFYHLIPNLNSDMNIMDETLQYYQRQTLGAVLSSRCLLISFYSCCPLNPVSGPDLSKPSRRTPRETHVSRRYVTSIFRGT